MSDDSTITGRPDTWVLADGVRTPIHTEMKWQADEPYQVVVTFRPRAGTAVEWRFSRELLTKGMRRRSGIGDVVVSPDHAGMLGLQVRSHDGGASLLLTRAQVQDFLTRTYRRVSAKDEWAGVRNSDFERLFAS
jgi:hypothetical protein